MFQSLFSYEDGSGKRLRIDPEDFIAMGAVLVALFVVFGMIAGKLPLNAYTYGLAGLSLIGVPVAKMIQVRRARPKK